MDIPVGYLTYRVSHSAGTDLSVSLKATTILNVLADVKKFAQFNAAGVESVSYDATVFNLNWVKIDSISYNRSNEYHVTRIRQQDPRTKQWMLCDVHLFSSDGANRVNAWVEWKGQNLRF
ncbi:MAG: hypothetical protein LBP26_05155 [Clostridiales bacterium]|nr:hypothetical protein [Clostridiales bacterium]